MTIRSRFTALLALCFGVAIIAAIFTAPSARASVSNNIGGYAWSSNIGWVKLNNCINPLDPTTCTGPDFGVNVQNSGAGTVTGYAWSSNIGWISFEPASVSGCPSGFSQCEPMVDWGTPSGGLYKMKGWARACSVFASGCSGALKADIERGGWDGWIALGVPSTGNASHWPGNTGVMVSPTLSLSGAAWGSEVVGWMVFNVNTLPECNDTVDNADPEDAANPLADTNDPGCHTDGYETNSASFDPFDNDETDANPMVSLSAIPTTFTTTVTADLTLSAQNFVSPITCTIDQGIGNVSMNNTGGNDWSAPPLNAPQISVTTTYTATCISPISGMANDSATVTKQGVNGICNTTHYNCMVGNDTNHDNTGQNTNGQNIWSWTCEGVGGGTDDLCEEVFPECSDGIDNADPEDRAVDINDPGCHANDTINTANPALSYDPDDTNEGNKRKPIFIEF